MARLQSLRLRVVLLVLLVLGPAVVLLVASGDELRDERILDVERNALRIARSAATEEDRLIEGARQLLTALARLPEVRQAREDCSALFRALQPELPQYSNIGAAAPDGTVFCSARAIPPGVSLADRGFFHRARDEGRFVVGQYLIGRVSGRPALGLAYPVLDAEGRVDAVVFAGLDLAWLDEVTRRIDLPEGAIALVVGPSGRVLSGKPPSIARRGEPLASPSLLARLARGTPGALRTAELDGADRIYGFTQLRAGFDDLELWVIVGIPAEQAFAEVDAVTRRGVILLVVLGAIGLVVAWSGGQLLVIRPVRALARTARRLQRGDLSARTGMQGGRDELSELARAFDEMAASLERTNLDLRARANELAAFAASASALVRNLEIEDVAEVVVEKTSSALGADQVMLWLAEEDSTLRLVRQQGVRPEIVDAIARIPIDNPLPAGDAVRQRRVILVDDLGASPRYPRAQALARDAGWRTTLCLPLSFAAKLVGVLGASRSSANPFASGQVRLATGLGDLFAAAVANARLFRAVQESLWLREAFIAAAAHELRTPATALKSYSQLLLRRDGRDERERHALRRIARLADRTAHLARELEEAHALSTGLRLHLGPVPLRELVANRVKEVQERHEEQRIVLCAGEEIVAEADGERLALAIDALLENALRHPSAGAVRVTLERQGEEAVLEVLDFGPGIPPERLPHVFEPLFEPWPPGSPWYSGVVGLGLYLARTVAIAHGGSLEARSEEGEGSLFVLRLPLRAASPAEANGAEAHAPT